MFRNNGIYTLLHEANRTWNPVYYDDLDPIYWNNPYFHLYQNYPSDERGRLIGYAQADYALTPWLTFMGRVSVDTYKYLQEERKAVGSVSGELGVDRPDVTSGYSRYTKNFIETNFDAMAKVARDLTDNIGLVAFVGTNIRPSNGRSCFCIHERRIECTRCVCTWRKCQPHATP